MASGQVRVGERLPSIRAFARQLGINHHTVRAAYKKLEEESLISTRRGTGSVIVSFDPLLIAERMSGTLSHTVGVIVPDLANPFYPAFLSGVEDAAREAHILPITGNGRESPSIGRQFLQMLTAKQVDGLIVGPYGLDLNDSGGDGDEAAPGRSVPIVYVDRPEVPGYRILLDAAGAGFQATRHLLEHGHRGVALISGKIEIPTLADCFSGYKRALQSHKLALDKSMVIEVDRFSFESGYAAAWSLLNLRQRPTAIFAAGDLLAIGAIRAIHDAGLSVPEDIAVVGYNDIDAARFTKPRLTSVATPTYELGVTSMRLLYRLIRGERVEERCVVLPTELVVRESCGCIGEQGGAALKNKT